MKIKVMKKDIITVLLFVGMIGIFTVIGINSITRKRECGKTVILYDNSTLKADKTVSYRNGMTAVISCDGKKIMVPTVSIKMIK